MCHLPYILQTVDILYCKKEEKASRLLNELTLPSIMSSTQEARSESTNFILQMNITNWYLLNTVYYEPDLLAYFKKSKKNGMELFMISESDSFNPYSPKSD